MTFLQALSDGMVSGSIYALIALSFTLIWASMRTVNLALLQVGTVAGLTTYLVYDDLGAAAALVGVAAGTIVGTLAHILAIELTRDRDHVIPLIASVGVGLIIQSVLSQILGGGVRPMPSLLPDSYVEFGGVAIKTGGLIILGISVVIMAIALIVLNRTSIGLGFKACAWNPTLAELYGVDVRRVRYGAAIVGAALAGVGGLVVSSFSGSIGPYTGLTTGLMGLVAMLIGGAGSFRGAIYGGLCLGLVEAAAGTVFSSSLKGVAAFAVLLGVLLVRPAGLTRRV